ncbi:NAD(P)/FAD-dependent oxidoreductase (plasmid) [Streptomyces sp. R39]|uniref:NAD(P)/FAD-dependent oxidoreductase n=1 Tax=Streptomyces sp. R39 TaxID=3238631 RepID=A0AB39R207_9ACTN
MSQKAVVIGAGIAGLLAAAAISQAAPDTEVLLLERDMLHGKPEDRRGVPQGRHAHLLMAGGLAAMESLFPVNMRDRLLKAGAHEVALANGMLALSPAAGWFYRWRRNGPHMITCTRALLDWVVRQALQESTTRVTIHQASVEGLLGTAQRITGVRISPANGILPTELEADFVIDTSGRGSRNLEWLKNIGITDIEERKVDSGLTNATRIYRTPPGAESFPLTMIQSNPYNGMPGRSAMVLPIEGNRWMVSEGGTRGGEPPKDPHRFLQYALSLPHSIVGQLISSAEPLTDVVVSRSTSNVRRYFEKSTLPERFLPFGDALATFNPAYGQGMSVAALSARALAQELHRTELTSPGLSRRVLREAVSHVSTAWATAVGMDVLYPNTQGGELTFADRLTAGYARRITQAAASSPDGASALWEVTSLTASPTRLVQPKVLLAALTGPLLPQLSEPPLTPSERSILQRLQQASINRI